MRTPSKKRILQLGGGMLQLHSVRKLQEAGFEVYVADKNPDAPAKSIADGFSPTDIVNSWEVTEYARSIKADAIIATNDAGVIAAAYASAALRLRYILPDVAHKATDKGLMRETWQASGLSQPEFRVAHTIEEVKMAIEELGYPVIVKPCKNWGSRGISAVYSQDDVPFALEFAAAHTLNNRFIIERMISGTEMTIEGLSKNGQLQILSRSDKVHQQHKQYRVAMELNYPSDFPKKVLDKVDQIVTDAALALGIDNAAIHCEVIVNDNGAFLVEMAARPGGGHIFGVIVEAQSGVNMPVALAKILLNEEVDLQPKCQNGVSYHFFAPPPGIFGGIYGIEAARNSAGVLDIGWCNVPIGREIKAIEGDADRPGYLVTKGEDQKDAIEIAKKIIDGLTFKVLSSPLPARPIT